MKIQIEKIMCDLCGNYTKEYKDVYDNVRHYQLCKSCNEYYSRNIKKLWENKMNNKLIEELYNKIDNQENIIRELQEENEELKQELDQKNKIIEELKEYIKSKTVIEEIIIGVDNE